MKNVVFLSASDRVTLRIFLFHLFFVIYSLILRFFGGFDEEEKLQVCAIFIFLAVLYGIFFVFRIDLRKPDQGTARWWTIRIYFLLILALLSAKAFFNFIDFSTMLALIVGAVIGFSLHFFGILFPPKKLPPFEKPPDFKIRE